MSSFWLLLDFIAQHFWPVAFTGFFLAFVFGLAKPGFLVGHLPEPGGVRKGDTRHRVTDGVDLRLVKGRNDVKRLTSGIHRIAGLLLCN